MQVSVTQRDVMSLAAGRARSVLRAVLPVLAVLLLARPAVSATDPIPPPPTRWVTDNAAFLSEAARAALDRRLEAYEQKTGHQVIVWIGTTLNGVPIEDFTVHAFEKWRVGRKGSDDGLALFVFSQDRRMRIEVGYGLEDRVPDAIASRIINNTIGPRLKSGDRDAALTEGVEAILAAIEGGTAAGATSAETGPAASAQPPERGPPHRQQATLGQIILFAIVGLVFLVILVTHPRLALWILFNMLMNSGRGGGGGFGGSGGSSFSGGGGRSGGGGASGSW